MRKIVNACDLWWLVWWVWGPDMKQNQVVKVITCVYSSLCSGTWLLNRRRMTSRKFISLKTGAKLYYTINVVGGRDFSVTAQADLDMEWEQLGISVIFSWLSVKIQIGLLSQNRARSPDTTVCSPQTCVLFAFFFFPGILFLTNRTL